eukprot:3940895-Rhodomonas_salina.3
MRARQTFARTAQEPRPRTPAPHRPHTRQHAPASGSAPTLCAAPPRAAAAHRRPARSSPCPLPESWRCLAAAEPTSARDIGAQTRGTGGRMAPCRTRLVEKCDGRSALCSNATCCDPARGSACSAASTAARSC